MTSIAPIEDPEESDPETYEILGAAMEVHTHLGPGFLESVYQEALAIEFANRNVSFLREFQLPVNDKGTPLSSTFRADFICFGAIIVELKALGAITTREHSQNINYLKATNLTRGLLINFGANRLEFKRLILSRPHKRHQPE